jgi:hypothetical protein
MFFIPKGSRLRLHFALEQFDVLWIVAFLVNFLDDDILL